MPAGNLAHRTDRFPIHTGAFTPSPPINRDRKAPGQRNGHIDADRDALGSVHDDLSHKGNNASLNNTQFEDEEHLLHNDDRSHCRGSTPSEPGSWLNDVSTPRDRADEVASDKGESSANSPTVQGDEACDKSSESSEERISPAMQVARTASEAQSGSDESSEELHHLAAQLMKESWTSFCHCGET